jgi:phosphoenolpyruvate carboxykinase (GTP)
LIFNVNWFRKGTDGKFLWSGFGENMRVLKWIVGRCEGHGGAVQSPIGWLPSPHDLDLADLDIDHKCVAELLGIDHEEWQKEIGAHEKFFKSLGGVVPEELLDQSKQLAARFKE